MNKEIIKDVIKWMGNKTTVGGYSERDIEILTDECVESLTEKWMVTNENKQPDISAMLPHVMRSCFYEALQKWRSTEDDEKFEMWLHDKTITP